MPRPTRSKVAPSAPAKLPESIMRAIQADAESKAIESQPTRRSSSRISKEPQEVFMSGALGKRVASPVIAKPKGRVTRQSTSSSQEQQEIVPSSIQSEDARLAMMPSPFRAPSTIQRPTKRISAMPSANWRIQATPRLDSSVLGNFKRRPRQPSILGIGRQDESSLLSSLGGGHSDPFYDELEDFNPVVATPAVRTNAVIRRNQTQTVPTTTTISSSPPASDSRKRKRTPRGGSAEIQVQRSPLIAAAAGASLLFGSSPLRDTMDDVELPAPKRSNQRTSRTSEVSSPDLFSATMAPPQSSPSEIEDEPLQPVAKPPAKQRAPRKKSTAIVASTRKTQPQTRGQKSRALQPISTAQLQNLLPRRNRTKADESLSITNIDPNDSDEASFMPTKRTRQTSKQPKTPAKKSTTTSKAKSKASVKDKSNHSMIPGSALRKSVVKKTFSKHSRAASGQENTHQVYSLSISSQDAGEYADLDPVNTSLEDLDSKSRLELDAVVAKFAEVDEWELEFEEVDNSSSSGGSGLLLGSR